MKVKDKNHGMYWLDDPWLIDMASRDNRLAMRKTVGHLSGGTMVTVEISHADEGFFYVSQTGSRKPPIMVQTSDLVIRRKRH